MAVVATTTTPLTAITRSDAANIIADVKARVTNELRRLDLPFPLTVRPEDLTSAAVRAGRATTLATDAAALRFLPDPSRTIEAGREGEVRRQQEVCAVVASTWASVLGERGVGRRAIPEAVAVVEALLQDQARLAHAAAFVIRRTGKRSSELPSADDEANVRLTGYFVGDVIRREHSAFSHDVPGGPGYLRQEFRRARTRVAVLASVRKTLAGLSSTSDDEMASESGFTPSRWLTRRRQVRLLDEVLDALRQGETSGVGEIDRVEISLRASLSEQLENLRPALRQGRASAAGKCLSAIKLQEEEERQRLVDLDAVVARQLVRSELEGALGDTRDRLTKAGENLRRGLEVAGSTATPFLPNGVPIEDLDLSQLVAIGERLAFYAGFGLSDPMDLPPASALRADMTTGEVRTVMARGF